MAKDQDLYEYQYTTPNKKVVKTYLPAVQKPREATRGKTIVGGILTAIGVLGLLDIPGMIGAAAVPGIIASFLLYGAVTGVGVWQLATAKEAKNRQNRYFRYMKALEDKHYASIADLAAKVAKPAKTVVKDLQFMIEQKWFLEGHLDRMNSYFMLTDKAYEQYQLGEKGRLLKEEEQREKEKREQDPRQKELAQLLEEGNQYIKQIHSLNEGILGEEISSKLYKIEDVVTSIFDQVKRKPEKMTELRKLMQYYLPMTIKVVSSYRDFENEKIPSEQLEQSKKEIEETLDKEYLAFTTLREKLFQDDVLDVSTDLDVLEAMMSQEGLIQDELHQS
jgi:hypothetical protein